MKNVVYIIYSKSLGRFYVGQTKNLEDRLERLDKGESKYTSKGTAWELIKVYECKTRSEAMELEKKI